ncbi:glycosyltransferase family 2 protein [Kordiimonas aestuarii]|uniref:glycosyltransferase family 2 protein n=1 Tax=Kordiimonas aestuarii TaxID=1005925 RepID=UPI0021D1687F|nr:glycosyltransferase family 2 protein [Kordiimonas aestuarii]
MIKPAKILSITMVKNEQDIIEPFVRHNLHFVDFMVVIDNNSTDETRRILEMLARETDRIAVFDRHEANFTQGAFLTRVMHAVQSVFFADFIVMLDGDEFIGAEDGQQFRESLETIPEFGFGLMPWITYVLPEGQDFDAMTADPPRSMQWVRREEGEQFYKVILRPAGRILRGYNISNGNHSVSHGQGAKLASVKLPSLPLLHFPVRSLEQLTAKCVNGWMAMLAKQASGIRLEPNECHQWRENFERATKGTLQQELAKASYFYSRKAGTVDWEVDVAERDHRMKYQRRHSDGRYADPLRLVGKAWEATYADAPSPIPVSLRSAFLDWSDSQADQDNPPARRLDVPFLRWIYDYGNPKRVLEIGCGSGANLLVMNHFGAETVTGADRFEPDGILLRRARYYQGATEHFTGVKTKYDMVLCLGALSGLQRDLAVAKAKAVAASADKHIVFLAETIDGDGNGTLSLPQWLSVWRQLGWLPDVAATLSARAVSTIVELRRSVIILCRDTEPAAGDDSFLVWHSAFSVDGGESAAVIIEEPFGDSTVEYSLGFHRKAS